ncbi:methyltransferase domain-containing protein [Dankookia rubra]|uniref:Methyltransferase domain-containing protein n=1 Tax=Dankookia rubra TaxID=1442381 RepID=A0A4R5QB05_9PROT|nr:methyltransferase domain-containing protein [Dankookia rubra]TDH60262.1 methyltransferase domain-containing protein [Dankookia rubra]
MPARAEASFAAAVLGRVAEQVTCRYAGASRFARGFVRGKLRGDPATATILRLAAAAPFGSVVDLGCGRGQLGLALLLTGLADQLTGLDRDATKISEAAAAAVGLPACFAVADLTTAPVPDCDTLLIIDVLLQMPEAAQRALLGRMVAAARRRILIRAFDPDCGWRAQVGFAMERLGRRVRRDGVEIRPLPLPLLQSHLTAAGFAVRVVPCWAGTPLPNVLLIAERPPA